MSSLTFFIDLCSHRKIIACLDEERTLLCAEIPDHTDEADLMPSIQRLLKTVSVSLHDLSRIAAVSGPGGFMSQRVEMSLSNALSWGLSIPIAGIHLSDVWNARAQSSTSLTHNVLWLHSTQKTSLFIRGFGAFKAEWPEASLHTLDDARKNIPAGAQIVGELIPEHLASFVLLAPNILKTVEDVLPIVSNKASYGPAPILPWYGRSL